MCVFLLIWCLIIDVMVISDMHAIFCIPSMELLIEERLQDVQDTNFCKMFFQHQVP